MATKMYFSSSNCQGATSGATGRTYNADKKGFIHVDDSRDIKSLKDGGYVIASGVGVLSAVRQEFVCDDCSWTAVINSCGKCGNKDLRRVEK
jgi:hypothetical protein